MAVTSISMLSETNAYDGQSDYDEPPQGATYDLVRIYKVTNDDSEDQYFKFVIELDSYGNAGGNYGSASDAIPKKFVEVRPVQETVTVFR